MYWSFACSQPPCEMHLFQWCGRFPVIRILGCSSFKLFVMPLKVHKSLRFLSFGILFKLYSKGLPNLISQDNSQLKILKIFPTSIRGNCFCILLSVISFSYHDWFVNCLPLVPLIFINHIEAVACYHIIEAEIRTLTVRWRVMLYIASVPGFVLALGMQFAVDSPRWLCKVCWNFLYCAYLPFISLPCSDFNIC